MAIKRSGLDHLGAALVVEFQIECALETTSQANIRTPALADALSRKEANLQPTD